MSRKTSSGDYEVGYRKPPVSTQFKPGVSGNPKGRPKGSQGLNALLSAALNERVIVNEGGRRRRVSKLEVALKQLANKAAVGDPRATRLLLDLLQQGEAEAAAKAAPQDTQEERRARSERLLSAIRERSLDPGGGK